MSKRIITISLDSELLAIINKLSSDLHYSRSEIIEFLIRKALREYEEYRKAIRKDKQRLYDIADRVLDELIRKYMSEKE